ncbi:MAG: CarD family transcriptional regulator, partial [Gammaproteobacteria bacterium]
MTLLNPILPFSGAPVGTAPVGTAPVVKWGKLYGAAAALAIAEAAAQAKGPLIVIAQNTRDAEALSDEIRFFAGSGLNARVFPDLETLPYDSFSAHPDITSARLATLAELPRARQGVWLVAIDTLLQRLAPRSYVEAYSLKVHVGETLDLDALRAQLALAGYAAVTQVVAHGEFAVRGSLVDVFPMGSDTPYRIDLLDRDVDSIRRFDPDTQRSLDKLDRIHLLPARETPLHPEAVREFRRRYRLRFTGDLSEQAIYRDVSQGIAPGGIEFFLPLFFDRTSHLFEYLPPDSVIVDVNDAASAVDQLWRGITDRHEQLRHDRHRPILDPAEVYLTPSEFAESYAAWQRIELHGFEWPPETAGPTQNFPSVAPAAVRIDPRAEQPAAELVSYIHSSPSRILLAAESAGRRELLLDLLRGRDIQVKIFDNFASFIASPQALGITVSAAVSGLRLETPPLQILTEAQLFGDRARQERRRRRAERDPAKILKELTDLRIGAPVVHESYGVGRYVGLQTMDVAGYTGEFLVLEYADGDKLYVPVQALHRVSRYTGAPAETAPLHKLGGEQWQKARRKAAQRIRDVAAELLDLYSRRAARQGTQMQAGEAEYRAFQAGFPFEETADQAAAIEQVLGDLKSGKPMDRVICGDVGFGKTEVALRAA